SVDGSSLTKEKQAALKKQILAQPYLFVGQEKIDFATSPSWVNGKIEPRNALFRTFLVSQNGSYMAMKGGLTRTSSDSNGFLISNQLGGMSKDTWILSPEPEHTLHTRKEMYGTKNIQDKGGLPSHTAENLFWVGRYAERFLGNAR